MKRRFAPWLRGFAAHLLLGAVAGTAAADVVFLKSGQRLEGAVTPTPDGYELKNDLGTWPIPKADVVRIVPDFDKLMLEAEIAHKQARDLYAEALKIEGDVKTANAKLRQGVELLRKAADLYNLALETYTDPKYGDLSKPMTKLFQEMRIYRDKMHSENAPPSAPPKPVAAPVAAAPPPPPTAPVIDPAAALAQAAAGDVEAMAALGGYHDDREWDSPDAQKWLRAAADKNHPTALFRLGRLYLTGKGVRQDPKEAQKWFLKADAAGSGLGRAGLARLEALGALGPRDLEKAWDWGRKAIDDLERLAADGDPDALLALAWIHREGLGRLPDVDRALDYYKTAAGRPS
ncbi:MAG TPA: tetratricopeptide repeat protein, partial [Planctomycetota bacterium]|nr:tetratricopeptide repeat protein [Planctomycetota bacterium]